MMRNSGSQLTPAGLFSAIMVLFLDGIAFFTLFSTAQIQNYNTFRAVIVFASINLIILLALALSNSFLLRTVPIPTLVSIWFVTVVYTLLQFVYLAFSYKTVQTADYILYHLIVLFVYFLFVIPAFLMGARKNK